MSTTRRSFLGSAALGALAANAVAAKVDPKTGMPMRVLGKTKANVSILGFGCGSRWLMYKEQEPALQALDRALKAGVNYVDTAANYGDGKSEQWVGEYLKGRKKEFFLVTKISPRNGDDAMRIIERSLKNLGVSQVDLMHMHALANEDDLAKIEAPDGLLKVIYKMREQKVARFVGVTCHQNPQVLKTTLERHDLDCVQMALNIARIGNAAPSDKAGQGMTGASGFELVALPVALRKKMGVTAMKIFGADRLSGKAEPSQLLRYSLSLPVAAAVVGMPKLDFIDANTQVAKNFSPLTRDEMNALPDTVSAKMRAALDHYFADHVDA